MCAPNYRLLQVADENADILLSFPHGAYRRVIPLSLLRGGAGPTHWHAAGLCPQHARAILRGIMPPPPGHHPHPRRNGALCEIVRALIVTDASSKGLGFAPGVAPTAAAVTPLPSAGRVEGPAPITNSEAWA